jgi:hypothetical protein
LHIYVKSEKPDEQSKIIAESLLCFAAAGQQGVFGGFFFSRAPFNDVQQWWWWEAGSSHGF